MRYGAWLKRSWAGLVLAGLLIFSAGCSGKAERAKVKGHVKFFDKDLTAGTVTFTSKDGIHNGSSPIDFNGNYEINDAPVGEVIITVRVPAPPKVGTPKERPKPPPGVPEMKSPEDDVAFNPTSGIDPNKIVQVPGKYANVDTSGLTYTVTRGDQVKDIVLSP